MSCVHAKSSQTLLNSSGLSADMRPSLIEGGIAVDPALFLRIVCFHTETPLNPTRAEILWDQGISMLSS